MTARELQVAALRNEGLEFGEIGAVLGISRDTVKGLMGKAAARLGLGGTNSIAVLNRIFPVAIDENKLKRLNPRERDIARGVVAGKTNAEIAAEVDSRVQVVKNHLHNIFDKIGASNRVELRSMLTVSQ